MPDRLNLEALFLEHLDWIDRVASIACSKHGVWGADAEDFAGQARVKLMEDDYAVLRRFRGDSELKTYLASVVARHFVSYIRSLRGRWRPSAAAMRLGPLATDLEQLVRREGYTLKQACEKLRTAGRTTQSDAELGRLLDRIPLRDPLRAVEVEPELVLDATAGTSQADERVVAEESATRREEMLGALREALRELEPEEQAIVRLRFADGRTLADVARVLHLEQKPLYRRVEGLRVRLRTLLESAGLRGDDVRDLLFEAP